MIDKKSVYNPWTLDDENEHPKSILEWWCVEAFFKSIEDNSKWTFKGNFTEWFVKSEGIGLILSLLVLSLLP